MQKNFSNVNDFAFFDLCDVETGISVKKVPPHATKNACVGEALYRRN